MHKIDEVFDIHLEINRMGRSMAHVLQLPGCIVRAPTPEMALDHVDEAIRQTLFWSDFHAGKARPVPAVLRTRLVEQCTGGAASGSGSRVALFKPDYLQLKRMELEGYLQNMSYSRKDLLEITSTLPGTVLMYRPDRHQRPIREILQHIASAEQWYLTRLMKIPRFPAQKTPLLRLACVREAAIRLLSKVDLGTSAKVVENSGEPWTLRKVLRRFLEHEREHMLEIEWRLHAMGLPAFPMWMPGEVQARELLLSEVFHF
jgi:hypothetical protein